MVGVKFGKLGCDITKLRPQLPAVSYGMKRVCDWTYWGVFYGADTLLSRQRDTESICSCVDDRDVIKSLICDVDSDGYRIKSWNDWVYPDWGSSNNGINSNINEKT